MKSITNLLIFFFFSFTAFSQSLEELKRNIEEKQDAVSWNELAAYYNDQVDTASCRSSAEIAYELAIKENNEKETGIALMFLSKSYMYQTQWQKYIQVCEKALHHFQLAGEIELQLEALSSIGYAYNTMGELDEAISVFKKALNIIEENGIQGNYKGVILINTAFAYLYKGELDSTKNYIGEALIAAETARDTVVLIESYNQLGIIYKREGNYQKALDYYEKSLRLYELSKDYKKLCTVWINISTLYYDWGKFDKALEIGRKALNIAKEYSLDKTIIGQILGNIGLNLTKTGQSNAGLDTLRMALPYLKNSKFQTYILYLSLSNAFENNNQTDSCEFYIQKAEEILEQNKNYPAVRLYKHKGTYLFRKGRYNEAIPILENYAKEYSDNPTRIHLSDSYIIYNILSESYELGPQNYAAALKYKKIAYEQRDSLYKEEHNITINDFYARYQAAEKELEISKLNEEKQKDRFRSTLIISVVIILAILFLIAFLYNRIKRIKKEKEAVLLSARVEQKETEYKTLMSEIEQRMLRRYLDGLESERNRLAKEIHDGIANDLLSIILQLDNDSANQVISGKLEQTYNDVRNLSHRLIPPILTNVTLADILVDFVRMQNAINQPRIALNISSEDDWQSLPSSYALETYRIIQEAVSNSLKHSKATVISLDVSFKNGVLSISIEDNGKGFDVDSKANGIGLKIMKERAGQLNSNLEIDSQIGKGTRIYFQFNILSSS